LMQAAYASAVGERAAGEESSKFSLLRRSVLGRRLRPSARATVAPAGPLGFGLDEVGLPSTLARALLGVGNRPITDRKLDEALQSRWFWIKRDPVLHRWGLLPVRTRLVEGDAIRLPASLLGPMGADFDGDTVALFADLPGQPLDCGRFRPSTLAWDEILERPMFLATKQYRYGLGRLMADGIRLANLQKALRDSGAPALNGALSAAEALTDWVRQASGPDADGRWWSIVEEHALAALAEDPGMGFGVLPPDDLAKLPVVEWGAAKRDIFDQGNPDACETLRRILGGESLAPYTIPGASQPDPIADVMVAAKVAVGRFGGALRRLLYTAPVLSPAMIADAQTLTEQVTQRVLSVKAGKRPIPFAEYERQLRRILDGQSPVSTDHEEMQALLDQVRAICDRLGKAMSSERMPWLDWLRASHELADRIDEMKGKELRLPLNDQRVQSWLKSSD
jgi:RNA polymerase Rpb1, domain 2